MKIQPPYLPSSDSTCQNSAGRWMLVMSLANPAPGAASCRAAASCFESRCSIL